jgi:NAD+ synthase (glutamine-hydrolysing)
MKYYSNFNKEELTDELKELVVKVREKRNFDVKQYVNLKVKNIISYMNEFGLNSAVISLSGGIDSAVVYSILKEVEKADGSPLKKLVPITLPVRKTKGVTNQEETVSKAFNLCKQFGDTLIEIDLFNAFEVLRDTVGDSLNIKGENWAEGQLVSYLRTPSYYYVTSLLNQEGYRPIICGTTNKDEGSYLGYFGKASDGMVDVQIISDIHKSEVYEVGKYLNVTEEILEAIPTGDMHDNRDDEDVFGAPYDFVELYLNFLQLTEFEKTKFILESSLDEDSWKQFFKLMKNLDDLHSYNKHKYLGCSPAVHFDIYESRFKGGWKYYVYGD